MRYAVVIPVFNERTLFPKLFERIRAADPPPDPDGAPMERRIVVVDDGSSDGTQEIAREICDDPSVHLVEHKTNQGKGAAVRTGIATALEDGADLVIIHDADLEYDPADHPALLAPVVDDRADVVIGTRLADLRNHRLTRSQYIGNRVITFASNLLSPVHLSDVECCSKVFRRSVIEQITIRENRFGLEPELVAKASRARVPEGTGGSRRTRVAEIPAEYAGRTYDEGKKITWRDGISAIRCVIRYNLFG